MRPDDLVWLHRLNTDAVPHVNALTSGELEQLLSMATVTGTAIAEAGPAGFVIALGPGLDYASPNYRWFSRNYERFLYVDRVIVGQDHRGHGMGQALYQVVLDHARRAGWPVACEVNIDPPNPASQRFHHRLGFAEVGRQRTDQGRKLVGLLVRPNPGPPPPRRRRR